VSRLFGYFKRHHWGMLATFIALGGTAYASGILPPHSVGTMQLTRGAVGTAEIQRGAVTLAKLNSDAKAATLRRPRQPAPAQADLLPPGVHVFWTTAPGYPGATYYRDTNGVVHIAGVVQSFFDCGCGYPSGPTNACGIAIGNGEYEPIFVLPPGDRPSGHLVFAVESGDANGRVDVTPDGWVSCVTGRADQYVSLDGITFRAGS